MQITILIAALVLFAAGVILSYLDKTSGATATYAAAVFCLIFVYISQFKRFKGFGLEAELKEKIQEADETLRKLRAITVPIAHMLFTMVSRMGRWDSMIPRRQRFEIMNSIETELKQNGVSKEDIEAAKKDWHRYNVIDLARPIMKAVANAMEQEIKERHKVTEAFKSPIGGDDLLAYNQAIEHWREASRSKQYVIDLLKLQDQALLPRELRRVLTSSNAIPDAQRADLQSETEEQLEDLEYYLKYHEFRRPEQWFQAEDA